VSPLKPVASLALILETRHDVRLFRASSVPIRRHTKIKGDANPYDPEWEPYFEARLGLRMAWNLRGRRQLLCLWKEQRITHLTGWHSHHLVWRTHGCSDRAENRVYSIRTAMPKSIAKN